MVCVAVSPAPRGCGVDKEQSLEVWKNVATQGGVRIFIANGLSSLALSRFTPRDAAMPPNAMTHEEKIRDAKRRAEEMKAKAAAKRAAKEAAAGGASAPPPPVAAADERFTLGEHSLILIDWDDTLFPTSAWKDRIQEGAAHPPRPAKIHALCQAISTLIGTLKQHGDVKLVTHGTKSWYEHSSKILTPETKALLDGLDHRYRDSHGDKYMRKKPAGSKYTTDIGVEVDNYGEWFKTDMFFHFISEKKQPRKWDETHLAEKVILPRQVLIVGDGRAEKRSYDEHGNQALIYARRPGHAAVASVGLKGVFLKEGPSFDELVLQQRWAAAHVASTFLAPNDFRTLVWDITGFPEWVSSLKAGANAYQPLSRGTLLGDAGGGGGGGVAPMEFGAAAGNDDEDEAMQTALALSMAEAAANAGALTAAPTEAPQPAAAEDDDEARAMEEAIALSLS